MQSDLLFKLDQDPRGAGLRCDNAGLFLGRDTLLRRDHNGKFEARAADELQRVFDRTYGVETNWESRIRSVNLVANALNKGELARAMMVAVLMRLPDPAGAIRIADVDGVLAKTGFNPDEARDERGRWTSSGSSDVDGGADRHPISAQLADAGRSDVSTDPIAQASVRVAEAAPAARPNIVLAAADDENEKDRRFGIGGNNPPLSELIPQRLLQSPAGPPIQFLDNLLDVSGPGDEANLEWAQLQKQALLNEILKVDPKYVYRSIEPEGGLEAMSWEGRRNVIYGLQADLAAAIYRVEKDIKPLQEVTFEFMQRAANAAYDEALRRYNAGELNPRQPRQLAIGNEVDGEVRKSLRVFYNDLGISMEPGSAVRVNRWAYNSSVSPRKYRVPDDRVGNLAFDVSTDAKEYSDAQIQGFFNADFKPDGVVIVRPNQLGSNSSYIIWRRKGG